MTFKLLAVGDLHLGRRPSRLPPALAGESRELGPAGAWDRLVEQAIRQGVHAVALAGDVVEREDDFYEAYRELGNGVKRLVDAGIRVLGVVGNHDVRVLPRLADEIDGFRLLGRDGIWERLTLEAGGETLSLHGWSFPQPQVRRSPLEDVRLERGDGPNLGLLHCDRDQLQSVHAPVRSRELAAAGLDGWLLGHIHAPDPLTPDNLSGYLGCVSGMDPGEPGDHGPWLITVDQGRIEAVAQWVLAPLRWEGVMLDISGLQEAEQVRTHLLEELRSLDSRLAAMTVPPGAVALRVVLTGRTALGKAAHSILQQSAGETIFDGAGGARYFIERCLTDTRPEIALDRLAERNDPPGLLARRLLWLEQPDGERAAQLVAEARQRLAAQSADARWQALHRGPPDDAEVIEWLRRSGSRLLEDMLEQHGEAGP